MIKKILTKILKSIIYTYLEKGKWNHSVTSENVNYFAGVHNLFLRTKDVPGHIIELGCGDGRNAIIFGNLLKLYNLTHSKKYFGFDSFEGYPIEVLKDNPDFDKTRFKYDLENVNLRLLNEKLNEVCKIIKGVLPKALNNFFESEEKFRKDYLKISIVYIDCNDYKTALSSVEILSPYFSRGCIIAVDENTLGGETKALKDFCNKKNLVFKNGDLKGVISSYAQIT